MPMQNIFDYIEHIKSKPHHIRKRIAFSTASIGTGLVALVWLASTLGSGTFALQETSFANSVRQESTFATGGGNGNQAIAGAAAALSDTSGPARIEIIDAASSTHKATQPEQTTIPF